MKQKHSKTAVVSINLTQKQIDILDLILKHGTTLSRSELIRQIIDRYLIDYINLAEKFDLLNKKTIRYMGS